MEEHIMQRRAVGFEIPEREARLDAGLKQVSRLSTRLQDNLPVGPALFDGGHRLSRSNAWQTRRIRPCAQADAARQHGLLPFLAALTHLFPTRKYQHPSAEPLP